MHSHAMNEARAEQLRLEWRKRVVYQVASAFAAVVTALSWVTREPGDVIVERGYPFLLLVLLVFVVLLRQRHLRLWPIEITMFGILTFVVLGRLAWHLHFAGSLDEHLLVLAGAHYWSVGALVVGAFVMLDRRVGAMAATGVLLVSLLLVATSVWVEVTTTGTMPTDAVLYLVRVHGFLAALLALTAAVSGMRRDLHRALARAEILNERATTDPMTGLANRWAGQERLAQERSAAQRYGRPLSIILLDLDNFKAINDQHGHVVGDGVLEVVADVLRRTVREVDLAVRWGGEEFLIIAPDTGIEAAGQLAERCRTAIADEQPDGLLVTATFGVAELRRGEELDDLMRRADRHLYGAKDDGRDRVGGMS
ncbi:MAG: GGDEF domain-containing protein [Nitriliruptor sp.]|nr:MAG: GGDEF domain-containing protein [Nitriliruptor sp.]